MKTEYKPDNTSSSIVVLFSSAIIVIVIAMIIGLSEKPTVDQIVLVPGDTSASLAALPSIDASSSAETTDAAMIDLSGAGEETTESVDPGTEATPERQIIVVPTSEPTPTPEVAAAVEPTPVPEDTGTTAQEGDVQTAPSLPTQAGSVTGSFFTGSDELAGAEVTENFITVSFAQDGSGAFQGVLDITYADGTRVELNMSGPITFAPANPQVEAIVDGSFSLDAPIAADDVRSDDAELRISSLSTGSGSLCTDDTKCFGFTFTPQ